MTVTVDLIESYLKSGQIFHRLRKVIVRNLYVSAETDLSRSVIVAGSGRSGTTWLSEIINFDNRYRLIFEPIRPEVVASLAHFQPKQYLRPDNNDEKYLKPIENILYGRIRNPFLDKHNMRFYSRCSLIKMIRGHLMLRWLHTHFPMLPIIFLLRHPLAVAVSKQRIGWDTEELEGFLEQRELVDDHLGRFINLIQNVRTDLERHVLIWCIENYIALKQFRQNELFITFYENLCERPQEEVKRLLDFLGEDSIEKVLQGIRKPSATAIGYRAPVMDRDIGAWRQQISTEQMNRCLEILAAFGFHEVYGADPVPHSDGLSRVMS
ncbi:MAG: sulfotransferase domain-containing protein [Gammaproteobacteria bacterium]|jgi:hypothetical protein